VISTRALFRGALVVGILAALVFAALLLIGLWWRRLRWQAAELLLATLGAQFWESVPATATRTNAGGPAQERGLIEQEVEELR
jgi:hypothetical protein